VKSRRFDTDAVLEKIIKHDNEGFASFYERYRGRVYRFIVRQYGTSEYGKAAYYSAWRHLVVAGMTSKTPKDLKLSFYQYLGSSVASMMTSRHNQEQTSYLPKDIEQDGNWSLTLIEHLKLLSDEKKRYFLFKYEIGISEAAMAKTFSVKRKVVESLIKETEEELLDAMKEAGLPDHLTLEKLYRGSRVVKPPVSWDKEILESFDMWLKQSDKPVAQLTPSSDEQEAAGLAGKWLQIRDQVKNRLSSFNKRNSTKQNRNRKFSSSHN
jgi:DNA-directed RNA polymerase specialized sigma24 family protein